MAGSKSDAWEADVLKMVTGQATTLVTTTPLANVYIALFTVAPSDTGGGTEVTGGSYARIDSKGKWGAPTGTTQVANNAVITFAQATADWAAGATTVVAFGIMTAVTAGTLLMWGTLTTAKNVLNGDTPSFAVGALVLTED
jgi:hypothetical protein